MNKLFSIICLTLLISASFAKKATTGKVGDTANEIKHKVVETVCCHLRIVLYILINIYLSK
jgi:hypothetical protein